MLIKKKNVGFLENELDNSCGNSSEVRNFSHAPKQLPFTLKPLFTQDITNNDWLSNMPPYTES